MGAITVSGKGSRSRVRDRKAYRDNYDAINWSSKAKAKARDRPRERRCDARCSMPSPPS